MGYTTSWKRSRIRNHISSIWRLPRFSSSGHQGITKPLAWNNYRASLVFQSRHWYTGASHMVLCINRPMKRSGSSIHQYRKRIPADVLRVVKGNRASVILPPDRQGGDPVHVAFKWGAEVRFSLQTRDPTVAKHRNAAASEQFEELFSIARAGPPPAAPLTTKQIAALAGDAYKAFTVGLEENPVLSPEQWKAVQAAHEADLIAEPSPLAIYQTNADYEAARQLVREANLERRYGVVADAVLAYRKRSTDAQSRKLLLREIAKGSVNLAGKLARNADGDYSPDAYTARFPEWTGDAQSAQYPGATSLSLDSLLSRWAADGEKSRRSLSAFRGVVKAFKQHSGHGDVGRVTKADVRAWRDALSSKGLSAKTINGTYIATIRTLCKWAVRNDMLALDPTEGVHVQQKRKAGKGGLPYNDDEVAAILSFSRDEVAPTLRWVPWLLALTGARVGEVTQLWGKHVMQRDGIHFIWITPTDDGGQLKTEESEREVPLHPALIEQGFLDFVATRRGGPLFYGGERATPRPPRPDASSHAAKGAANRVREWIRNQGFNDKRKAPNHAFRHWFKTACMRAGILDSVADAIQGHAGTGGEAAKYRHRDLATMAAAIVKLPVPIGEARTSASLEPI